MTGCRFILGTMLATIALAIAAAPARADDEIALSADGVTWGDELSSPLSGRGRDWVPGDAATRSFYVRNDGRSDARLRISVVTRDGDRLVSDGDVALSARVAGGGWSGLDNGQDVAPLVRTDLGEDRSVRVDIRASFRWASPNESMVEALPLKITVTLVQDGPDDGSDGGAGPDGLLPETGSAVPWWLVVAGAGLVLGGVTLVAAGRRREDQHE